MATHTDQLTGVSITDLTRRFGDHLVLDGVDLTIRPGEFVALLGRSGSGKSTLLRALAGLDYDVAGSGTLRIPERVSVVFQDSRLLPWRRVLDNVILGLRDPDARRRGVEALAEVGLASRERAWPNQLSGGEQQRVAVARALANRPALVLADEPTGNLDEATAERVFAEFLNLVRGEGSAALVAPHNERLAERMDRVVRLHEGKLE